LLKIVYRRDDAEVNAVLTDLGHQAGLAQPVADAAAHLGQEHVDAEFIQFDDEVSQHVQAGDIQIGAGA
jgi:hypothetical protein